MVSVHYCWFEDSLFLHLVVDGTSSQSRRLNDKRIYVILLLFQLHNTPQANTFCCLLMKLKLDKLKTEVHD